MSCRETGSVRYVAQNSLDLEKWQHSDNEIQCWGSVSFWCLSGSNFSSDFSFGVEMLKKLFFPIFFFLQLTRIFSLKSEKFNFLLKFCVKILFCKHYCCPLNNFIGKEKGSGSGRPPDPDPQHRRTPCLTTNYDKGPITCIGFHQSGYGAEWISSVVWPPVLLLLPPLHRIAVWPPAVADFHRRPSPRHSSSGCRWWGCVGYRQILSATRWRSTLSV